MTSASFVGADFSAASPAFANCPIGVYDISELFRKTRIPKAMGLNDDAGRLLDQLDVLRHPSDLDLLIFFARHPRALLASEQVARFLGYGATEIAASLDLLLEAGFLTRTPHPKHAARMYVFAPAPPVVRDGLFGLLQLASTRNGRLALMSALRRRSSKGGEGWTSGEGSRE